MIDCLAERAAELEAICRRYDVKRLELFGSAADGTFVSARSDLDFLVEFLPAAGKRIFHGYFDLKEELERLFSRPVDLVMPQAIRNRYFARVVDEQRKVLYAA